ncbi:MAG TPA: DUF302 domain-containing protein [Pirellulales bacterium]|nr:DUF302 domain-containing protein [Pirellulales bacterium]
MKSTRFNVERLDWSTSRSFEETVAAFEQEVPAAPIDKLQELASSDASRAQIETAVQALVGDLEFMYLAKLDPSPLVSRLGKHKKLLVYLLGNPVLANRMFEPRPDVGLYAPLRACIFEDYSGMCHFTYDRPSTLLQQFDDAEVRRIAGILDEKMARLADSITRANP